MAQTETQDDTVIVRRDRTMSGKWFVQADDRVEGPFTADDLKSRVANGSFAGHHLVWSSGMDQWRSVTWWAREGESFNFETKTEVIAQDIWHYAQNGESHGPFSKENLVDRLRSNPAPADILLWTKGMKEWAPLFEFHDILSQLGVNKRIYPRADIDGQVTIKSETGTIVAPALTISEGGMGVALAEGLVSGQQVSLELQCRVFANPLHAKADVRYVVDGIAGLRFTNLSPETKSSIISYVRQSQTRFVLRAG